MLFVFFSGFKIFSDVDFLDLYKIIEIFLVYKNHSFSIKIKEVENLIYN